MTEKKLNLRNPNEMYQKQMDPDKEYNAKDFDDAVKASKGLETIVQTLQNDPYNPSAWSNAGNLFMGNPDHFYSTGTNPRRMAEERLSDATKKILDYVSKNENIFVEKLKKDDYKSLLLYVPLQEVKDKEFKPLVDTVKEVQRVNESSQDVDSMKRYLQEKIGSDPEYVKGEFLRYMNNEAFIKTMFNNYSNYARSNLNEVFEKGDCEGLFKKALSETKDKRAYHSAITKVVYEGNQKKNN